MLTKKHFIALADAVRTCVPTLELAQLDVLADFCQAQNPAFNRFRWLGYIAGECGPNGGIK